MYTSAVKIPHQKLTEFCRRWQIQELALFGSFLREEFGDASDVDILVTFQNDAAWGILEHIQMERELERLFDREVDLVTKRAVERSRNWIRRQAILDSAQIIYSTREAAYAS